MADPTPKSRRRWFQMSLSSLLWLMALIAVLIFAATERSARRQAETQLSEVQALLDKKVNLLDFRAKLTQKRAKQLGVASPVQNAP